MDVIKAMFDECSNTGAETTTTTQEGEAAFTAEKITEMIDSAAEQFKNSTLNNKTEIDALKNSIDTLTEKINDISARLEAGDNIATNTPANPEDSE